MMRSMFAGVSGLRSYQLMMDVVGDNIANINTPGYKGSRVVFADTLSQMLRGGAGATGVLGGYNAQQVGLGVRVAGIDMVNTQGAIQATGRPTDVAIQGEGYFVVRSGNEQLFTRAGSFGFDSMGNLADPTGAIVQGWLADPVTGALVTSGPATDLSLPLGTSIPPVATSKVYLGGNLSASAAVGADGTASTATTVVDALGNTHRVEMEYVKTGDNAWSLTAYREATPDEAAAEAAGTADKSARALGTTTLAFDGTTGALVPGSPASFTLPGTNGAPDLTFTADFGEAGGADALTQFGGTSSLAIGQDGAPTGYLRSFSIADDGTVSGVFSNGRSKVLAQLAVAGFSNPAGLVKAGAAHFRAATASGDPTIGVAGDGGRGALAAGALEGSNVELAQEFTNMMIAQRGFQANSRIISTSDEMLQELVNLKR